MLQVKIQKKFIAMGAVSLAGLFLLVGFQNCSATHMSSASGVVDAASVSSFSKSGEVSDVGSAGGAAISVQPTPAPLDTTGLLKMHGIYVDKDNRQIYRLHAAASVMATIDLSAGDSVLGSSFVLRKLAGNCNANTPDLLSLPVSWDVVGTRASARISSFEDRAFWNQMLQGCIFELTTQAHIRGQDVLLRVNIDAFLCTDGDSTQLRSQTDYCKQSRPIRTYVMN